MLIGIPVDESLSYLQAIPPQEGIRKLSRQRTQMKKLDFEPFPANHLKYVKPVAMRLTSLQCASRSKSCGLGGLPGGGQEVQVAEIYRTKVILSRYCCPRCIGSWGEDEGSRSVI